MKKHGLQHVNEQRKEEALQWTEKWRYLFTKLYVDREMSVTEMERYLDKHGYKTREEGYWTRHMIYKTLKRLGLRVERRDLR